MNFNYLKNIVDKARLKPLSRSVIDISTGKVIPFSLQKRGSDYIIVDTDSRCNVIYKCCYKCLRPIDDFKTETTKHVKF